MCEEKAHQLQHQKCQKLSFMETQCVFLFDQIIGDKGRKQVNRKENIGKQRVQTFNISLGLACKKRDAMFCFVGVRSHFGSKQLWSMV